MGITDDPAALPAIVMEAVKFAGKSVIGDGEATKCGTTEQRGH